MNCWPTKPDRTSRDVRDDVNHDDPGDEAWPAWAGIIPIRTELGTPAADPLVPRDVPAPVPTLPARPRAD